MKLVFFSYYLQLLQSSYQKLAVSTVLSIGRSLLLIPMALLVRNAFDHVIPSGNIVSIAQTGLFLVLLQLIHTVAGLWAKYQSTRVARAVTKRVIDDTLKTLYALSRHYYSKTDWGLLHAGLMHQIDLADKFTETLLIQTIPSGVLAVILIAFLWYLNAALFLVLVVTFPLFWIAHQKSKTYYKKKSKYYWQAKRTVNRGILSVIQMMDLIRLQTAEAQESSRQGQAVAEFCQHGQAIAWNRALLSGIQETLLIVAGVIILVVGGSAVAKNQMTLGELMSFYAGILLLKPNLVVLMGSVPVLLDGSEALTSLYSLQRTDEREPYTGSQKIAFHGQITFQDVSFRYEEKTILQHINMTLQPGSVSVVIGLNGSGKSTIIYLILGFYRPQQGCLLTDGYTYDQLDIPYLRQQIGVVMQEPLLFPATVHENIAYGYPDATMDEIMQAAKLAMAHDFIDQLPQGYNTLIGEKGLRLSGGQRQRIAIARALLRKPKLLILDEPTNHLDEQATRQLLHTLKHQQDPPATLIISHDPRFSQQADQILHLRDHQLQPLEAAASSSKFKRTFDAH